MTTENQTEHEILASWPRNTTTVHRCLAILDEGPYCPNLTEPGRSYCTTHLADRLRATS